MKAFAAETLPVREEAKERCEILVLDPLYIANEERLVAIIKVP